MTTATVPEETAARREARLRNARITLRRRRARITGKTPELTDRVRAYLPDPPPVWEISGDPACASTGDPSVFFGPDHEAPRVRAARVTRARAICAQCPIQASCLDGALTRGERWGVWSGVDFETMHKTRSVKATRPAAATANRA